MGANGDELAISGWGIGRGIPCLLSALLASIFSRFGPTVGYRNISPADLETGGSLEQSLLAYSTAPDQPHSHDQQLDSLDELDNIHALHSALATGLTTGTPGATGLLSISNPPYSPFGIAALKKSARRFFEHFIKADPVTGAPTNSTILLPNLSSLRRLSPPHYLGISRGNASPAVKDKQLA